MKDMEIKFSDVPYDFSPWLQEKCENVLMELCRALQENPDFGNSFFFQTALFESLKIYALCCENLNGIYCELVRSLLIKYNIEGYHFLQDLVNGTQQSTFMKEIFQAGYDEKILELIEGNERSTRTKIAELLAHIEHPSCWITEIKNDIEFVHNGEKSWEWFHTKHGHDRDIFQPAFSDSFIKEVYEYFQSDAYKFADDVSLQQS